MSAPPTEALAARGISVGYRGTPVITDLDLTIPRGRLTCIIGPNGCGKSTLLKALSRLIPISSGRVEINGRALGDLSTRELATAMAVLPQSPIAPEGILVADLVALGRHPHQSWLRQWSAGDGDVVHAALAQTGVADLADRTVDSLSGGQRQRVWIAMVLAQQTDTLLLDEPTTFLDLSRSLEVLDLIDVLHTEQRRTVVMVLHDLALACRYSDELVVMRDGAVITQGAPQDVITEEMLWEVFGLRSRVMADPVSSRPLVVPVGERCTDVVPGGRTESRGRAV
ncbi:MULTISPECIES: ABC transporter ATP-binding protein [unclassified Gordonia (in: high G+C Gram-positive bacteria)]|uniref:ABC transporter ATP-binding protein n=1 Tax=unclassified Gordonia (in: high G+C Gram-positive bacteria) TaxID=2657482 RepID=UPI0009AE418F|nr:MULTISPECIES: ABC transporter ATP-binding protein [unclassified Gordonia (in: high G+C Gram-positive bacteria)]MDF3285209.1 ABC transporter ATP-binding protein [Gordonia sp. N1V]OPX11547.1 ABC transporter [Gordonia sp. i37]